MTCQDCGHQFWSPGQNGPGLSGGTSCPNCGGWATRDTPNGVPNDMQDYANGIDQASSTQDSMDGNPLQEGSLGGWQNKAVRDETFASVKHEPETDPELETVEVILPYSKKPRAHKDEMQDNALYNHRGNSHQSGIPGMGLIGDALRALTPVDQEVPGLDVLSDGADAEAAANAAEADSAGESAATGGQSGAGGIGSVMKSVLGPAGAVGRGVIGLGDDLLGAHGQTGAGGSINQNTHPESFYAHTASEDDAFPSSHDEIPKNTDGDSKEQADGNQHEWQRDISVDHGGGGAMHSPNFDPGGPGMERFMNLLPLLLQYLQTGESGAEDPLVQGLHQSLDAEIPGYLDHADDGEGQKLIMLLSPNGQPVKDSPGKPSHGAEPEKNPPDHTDENSAGKHESRYRAHSSALSLGDSSAGDFLADVDVIAPALNGFRMTASMTAEQIAAVQEVVRQRLTGILPEDQVDQQVENVAINPLQYMDVLADIQQKQAPAPPDAGFSAAPPQPAQENAPPGETMPVPGMDSPQPPMPGSQMQSSVYRVGADSVAGTCPNCGGHTTALVTDDGKSRCHSCKTFFTTPGIVEMDATKTGSHWHVASDVLPNDDMPVPSGTIADQQPDPQTGPSDQMPQPTWADDMGNPLKVGNVYEMSTPKYEIPDTVRVDAVKPSSIVLTFLDKDFGMEDTSELSKKEADLYGYQFHGDMDKDANAELGLETNNDDNSMYQGPHQDDLSHAQGMAMASNQMTVAAISPTYQNTHIQTLDPANSAVSWLNDGTWSNTHTAGYAYTPMEQRGLIDEDGVARNAGDSLQLAGTHYEPDEHDVDGEFPVLEGLADPLQLL